jgi:outer membrane protein assembly factor BamB
LSAGSGKKLWSKEVGTIPYHTPPDILVNRGLVWTLNTSDWTYEGREPTTGEKKKTLDVSLVSKGTHHNCFRNKATRDFFLYGRNKGIEYFNIDRDESKRINWLKGACRYGNMPANGMIYFPSHFCTCYATSKMNGIAAIGNTGITGVKPSTSDQVTKGSAFGKPSTITHEPSSHDWPTYRQNISRTGFQPVPLPDPLKVKWTSTVKGNLTPPVIADQRVFVASKDDHRVICLDAGNRKAQWTFLADGKVDSPPSVYKGRSTARDGHVFAECGSAALGPFDITHRRQLDERLPKVSMCPA